ncbi:hypothetical protein [Curtobacterium sp. RRHDQ10]|uniref:hypothetical protein n=1 Tax=Curtobacterium phyllosphaerae TaxID=3413379 RepID=UPI003BF42AD4
MNDDLERDRHPAGSSPADDAGWRMTPSVAAVGGVPLAGTTGRRARRRPTRAMLLGVVGGALVLVLVVVLGSIGYASGAREHAPARQVEAFLEQLRAGHAERALVLAHTPTAGQPLLTDAAYAAAADRISSWRILATSTDPATGSADVTALLTQAGRAVPQTFHLQRTGSADVFFSTWRIADLTLGSIEVRVDGPQGTPVEIDGVRVPTSGGVARVLALPGAYDVGIGASRWFTATSEHASVAGFTSARSDAVEVRTTLTAAGRQAATEAVDGWVDGCVAQTDLAPSGCSFSAYGDSPDAVYTNERWTLDTRPVASIGDWSGRGWAVRTTTPGSATFTADFTSAAGSGTGRAGPVSFSADGLITGFTDAGATFAPAVVAAGGGTADS